MKPTPHSGLDTEGELKKRSSPFFSLHWAYEERVEDDCILYNSDHSMWQQQNSNDKLFLKNSPAPLAVSGAGSSGYKTVHFIHVYLWLHTWVQSHCVRFRSADEGGCWGKEGLEEDATSCYVAEGTP